MEDIFLSYAHFDNAFQRFASDGWIGWFHRALDARLTQIRGCSARIWRDKKGGIDGNSVLTPAIEQALSEAKVFVAIFSPAYFASEWCRRDEHVHVERVTLRRVARRHALASGAPPQAPVLDKSQIGDVTDRGCARLHVLHASNRRQAARAPDGASFTKQSTASRTTWPTCSTRSRTTRPHAGYACLGNQFVRRGDELRHQASTRSSAPRAAPIRLCRVAGRRPPLDRNYAERVRDDLKEARYRCT